MRIKDGFVIRKIMDEVIVVPVGERIADFNALVSLNESGEELWKALQSDITEEQLVNVLLDNYEIDADTAKNDVKTFLDTLKKHNLIIE